VQAAQRRTKRSWANEIDYNALSPENDKEKIFFKKTGSTS
jgi:hypothetical protein